MLMDPIRIPYFMFLSYLAIYKTFLYPILFDFWSFDSAVGLQTKKLRQRSEILADDVSQKWQNQVQSPNSSVLSRMPLLVHDVPSYVIPLNIFKTEDPSLLFIPSN